MNNTHSNKFTEDENNKPGKDATLLHESNKRILLKEKWQNNCGMKWWIIKKNSQWRNYWDKNGMVEYMDRRKTVWGKTSET